MAVTPVYTYQYGANPPIDYPRLLIADTDLTSPIFADQEIMAMQQIETIAIFTPQGPGGISTTYGSASYLRTAAALLDSLAANTSRLAGVLKVLDVQLDSSKAAAELRSQAQALRDREESSGAFAMVELVYDPFTARERTYKMFERLYASN